MGETLRRAEEPKPQKKGGNEKEGRLKGRGGAQQLGWENRGPAVELPTATHMVPPSFQAQEVCLLGHSQWLTSTGGCGLA